MEKKSSELRKISKACLAVFLGSAGVGGLIGLSLALSLRPETAGELGSAYVVWVPTLSFVMIAASCVLFAHRFSVFGETLRQAWSKQESAITALLEKYCRPLMIPLGAAGDVISAAEELLSSAVMGPKTVTYIGSGGLIGASEGDGARDPSIAQVAEAYSSSTMRAMGERVPARRYVSLMTPEDFEQRHASTQASYLEWLQKQQGQLKLNPNYQLFHHPKAPGWGSSTSAIAVSDDMIMIVGKGSAGLRIKGEEVVEPMVANWKTLFSGSNQSPELFDEKRLNRYMNNELVSATSLKYLPSRTEVLQAARGVLEEVVQAPGEDGYLRFMGSGGLVVGGGEPDPDQEAYSSALARVRSTRLPIQRYIRLMSAEDFVRRAEATKDGYLAWVANQANQLEQSPTYEFFDCPRAQMWGGSRSSIISPLAIVDIIGNGQSGFSIRGPAVAKEVRTASQELFEKAHVKPEAMTASDLRRHMDHLRAADSEWRGDEN